MSVTVVTPSIPSRREMLLEAMASVDEQTLAPAAHIVVIDHAGIGGETTRNQGLDAVRTEWVAFLDDDDRFLPQHLERLVAHQQATGADLVYPWFEMDGITDELGWFGWFGKEFDGDVLRTSNYIPSTTLVRTSLAREVDGFPTLESKAWPFDHSADWGFLLRLLDAGAIFSHLPEKTWIWRRWRGNLGGRNWR
jgi:glycosyltransferase involved in cell wall biosynthesis